jgi:hypothetical protein
MIVYIHDPITEQQRSYSRSCIRLVATTQPEEEKVEEVSFFE